MVVPVSIISMVSEPVHCGRVATLTDICCLWSQHQSVFIRFSVLFHCVGREPFAIWCKML